MKVLVTGAAGFVGGRLVRQLLGRSRLPGWDGAPQPVAHVVAADIAPPADVAAPAGRLTAVTADLADARAAAELIDGEVGAIFHLSGVVSAGAEADDDLGYAVNVGGLRNLIAGCRRQARPPRLTFASSIAVYGGVGAVDDTTPTRPLTSYGTHKAIGELLLNDATRKGYVDGRALRLAAVVARPGAPNAAASGFASTIIREPLAGRAAVCPVPAATPLPMISAARAVAALEALHGLDGDRLGPDRAVLMGALSPTARDVVDGLARIAGAAVAARVRWQPDPAIMAFVDGWPRHIAAARAARLGLVHDDRVDTIIAAYIDEAYGGTVAAG